MSADFTHGEDEYLLETASMVGSDMPDQDVRDEQLAAADHTTGRQLRHRLVTPESIAQLEANEKPSLLQRLLRRK
ncbi:hypothetical protein [Novosphingobium album (ex Hu et al. 2023)]|uniref:Uncharacterized protein n=1 Tax=Novosphingobium album (ex Hu et al. 2023) TaxID=2930093 RepID=A0ABT0AWJ6_9SPHN|nr:hypothetical protein [Novosphingobium album (ex Hu et al. 2023)]MCJ2176983.1 hypothetical protein [Novosphingobium album (ex Hu et al. 2023)]